MSQEAIQCVCGVESNTPLEWDEVFKCVECKIKALETPSEGHLEDFIVKLLEPAWAPVQYILLEYSLKGKSMPSEADAVKVLNKLVSTNKLKQKRIRISKLKGMNIGEVKIKGKEKVVRVWKTVTDAGVYDTDEDPDIAKEDEEGDQKIVVSSSSSVSTSSSDTSHSTRHRRGAAHKNKSKK